MVNKMNANDIDDSWTQSSSKDIVDSRAVDDASIPGENELIAANSGPVPEVPAPVVAEQNGTASTPPTLVSATEIKQQVSDTASHIISQAKTSAGQAVDKSKETASQAIEAAKQQVIDQLSTQKGRAADAVGNFKAPISEISQTFSNHGQPRLSSLSNSLAEQVGQVSDYLRSNDLDVITRDAQAYAKANPAIVIGGAFLLGVLTARFFKSSATATADPLLPVVQSNYGGLPASAPVTGVSDFNEPLPDNAPLTAHGYIDGGVLGGANT